MRSGFILRITVFLYDCLRLSFLLMLLRAFTGGLNGPGGMFQAGVSFPYMLYAAPNALFFLMSLFFVIRFERSRPFIPLYAAGKIIAAAALAGWMISVFTGKGLTPALRWSFFLGTADIASALGILLLKKPIITSEDSSQTVQE